MKTSIFITSHRFAEGQADHAHANVENDVKPQSEASAIFHL